MKNIEIANITLAQAEQILTLSEGHFLDLKSMDIAPVKLTRTISAFANASGGELYIELMNKLKLMKRYVFGAAFLTQKLQMDISSCLNSFFHWVSIIRTPF